jgi:tripartite-type tricarboxylate transporter receptor subunit TctC
MRMKKCAWFLIGAVFFFCFVLWHQPLQAQTYPTQTIEIVIPMSSGDTVDLAGRAIATEMEKILKVSVVVINKPGAGGTIGADSVVRGKKDGYTLLFAPSGVYMAHAVHPENVPYNPFTDLDPLCSAVSPPMLIAVLADSPWKNFGELMTYMKQNPGKVRGSTTGVGSTGFLNLEVIRLETGNAITMIPFKGASPALTALLGGHVETSALTLSLISPHLKAGKLRVLLTSKKLPDFPDIPTLKQLGYKRDIMSIYFAFYLPVGVPDSVKKVLVPALQKAIQAPDVVNAIRQLGAIEDFIPGKEFKKIMADDYAMAQQIMKMSATGRK